MIILLSPAKKQKRTTTHLKLSNNLFDNTEIKNVLKSLTFDQIKSDFKVSNNIANNTYQYFQNMDESSPAIFTYTGEAYNALDAKTLTDEEILFLNDHLLIFSALYGLLKPLSPITLYRLDMINKFEINLKTYWQDQLINYLNQQNKPLLNLASDEFFSIIDDSSLKVPVYHVHFQTRKDGKNKVVSAHAKKARGAFTRALIKQGFSDLSQIEVEDFKFSHQNENHYTYIKEV